jgi:hypothetical protein
MWIAYLGLATLFASGTAYAHVAMTSPAPRGTDQKTGPCGKSGSVRGTNVATFAPGATITGEWDETVDHPGHYRIAFDDDGNDFTNPNNPGDAFSGTMAEPIADKAGGRYTQSITLPTTPCENCTLQLIQVMTTSVPYNSFYFQCADLRIADGGDPGDDPGTGESSGGCSTTGGAGIGGGLAFGLLALRRPRRIVRQEVVVRD